MAELTLWRRVWYGQPPALAADAHPDTVTAAALSLRSGRDLILPRYEHWQDEAWGYWQELGELYYGVRWLSEMLSRVRLVAAKVPKAPGDEPIPVETGTPKQLVESFGGGIGGQADIIRRLSVQLAVPGEGWLVGEPATDDQPTDRWTVRSVDEIKRSGRRPRGRGADQLVGRRPGSSSLPNLAGARGYNVEVADETTPPGREQRWRVLQPDALVVRIWNPHDRWWVQADSPTRHALASARKLQLANRYIQAQFLSRLASAGLVVLPDNVDFPVADEFEGQPDAVIKEWIATAATAIKNPGSAAAVVPILMQLPPDVVDKIKFLDFTTTFDEHALEKREAAVRELATVVDLPAEILLGMGDANHWTSWQIEESALKVHIAPRIEALCHAFTDGWFRPMLKEANEDPAGFLVWYDPSEIVVRPDKSEKAVLLYDRGEASGEALRRESGMDDSDKLEGDDLEQWALRQVLKGGDPALIAAAYKKLTGTELVEPAPAPAPAAGPPGEAEPEEEEPGAEETKQPPGTQGEPPPPPGEQQTPPKPVAAGAEMGAPGGGWPLQRRADGWYVRNVDHWLKLPDADTAALDARYREQAAAAVGGNGGGR